MRDRGLAWLAVWLCTLMLIASAVSAVLLFLIWQTAHLGIADVLNNLLVSLLAVITGLIGAVICVRRERNPIGWLCLFIGLTPAIQGLGQTYAIYGYSRDLPGAGVAAILSAPFVLPLPFVLLLLLFPTGKFLSRRWKWLAIAFSIYLLVVLLAGVIETPLTVSLSSDYVVPGGSIQIANPIGLISASSDFGPGILVAPVFVAMVLSVISLVIRFRRATGEERQQLKWFAYAALLFVAALVVFNLSNNNPWVGVLVHLAALGLPIAIGIAILRHRLYDIDIIIHRTLVYGALTALLALVFFGSVFALQAAFSTLLGQTMGRPSEIVLVVSTLIIAALALPLRNRIQAVIDRRFYRKKYEAEKVLEAFAARLQSETDEATLAADLKTVIQETLQPASVKVWLVDHSNVRGTAEVLGTSTKP